MRPAERALAWWWLPLLVSVAVELLLVSAALGSGHDYLDPHTWVRWDSFHYLDIARHGFSLQGCFRIDWWNPLSILQGALTHLGFAVRPTHTCGTAGWFPGYPMLIRSVSWLGLSPPVAGIAISIAARSATLAGIWAWFLRDKTQGGRLALVAAAFFFGHVYYRAVFPMSMVTFLLVLYMLLLRKKSWLWAGLVGAMAALTYPTLVVIAPVTVVWLWFWVPGLSRWNKVVASGLTAGTTGLGFLAVIVAQWIQTGVWGAFFEVQSQFGYGIHMPTTRLVDKLEAVARGGLDPRTIPDLQTILVAIVVLSILGVCVARWRALDEIHKWTALATLALWLFPLMLGGEASLYRIESVLLPMVILLPKMPRWFQTTLVGALVALSYPMAVLFFENILI